jgi:hypothetical protein
MSFITATKAVTSFDHSSLPGISGAHELDVLGFDPTERKLYLLEHYNDDSGDLPQLFFTHTRGRHVGRLHPVRSWYDGASAIVEDEFQTRLDALRARLVEVEPMMRGSLRLTTRVVKRRALRLRRDAAPIRKYALQLTVRAAGNSAITPMGVRTEVTAYLRPKAQLQEAYQIPGERVAVAIVSYVGIPFDVGHDKQVALLLPM